MKPNLFSCCILVVSCSLKFSDSVTLISGDRDDLVVRRFCPSYCKCDLFRGLNRADCSGQLLVNANVEVPTAVELLDLTLNGITILDNDCFQSLRYLVNVTIAHNAIHTIYLDAFSPLQSVRSIDLSYNRLEYFDERIFETNTQLTQLDLSGNKFMSLQNKPLLKSASLRILGLQNAQITHIYQDLFSELIALRELDISRNLMITLNVAAFNTMQELEMVNLEGNRWICDKNLDATTESLKRRGVQVQLNACAFEMKRKKKKKLQGGTTVEERLPLMFERMEMARTRDVISEEPDDRVETNIELVWKNHLNADVDDYYDGEEKKCAEESWSKMCQKYRMCLSNMSTLLKDKVAGEEIWRGRYTANDLNFVFLTGMSLGIAIVICILSCALCIKRCCEARRKYHTGLDAMRDINIIEYRRPIEVTIPPAAPPRIRRSPQIRNRSTVPPPQLNRSLSSPVRRGCNNAMESTAVTQGGDFATFIARLFERPTRHQYYRTLNQNTATLIRRLSRSNLFNSRLSQHDSASGSQQVETATAGEGESERLVCNQPTISPTAPIASSRPETPPPSYGDVVTVTAMPPHEMR